MEERREFQLGNRFEDIPGVDQEVGMWLEERGAPPAAVYLASLAIEEVVTNCIKYGYDDEADHVIHIAVGFAGRTLTMSIRDDGHAFDPLAMPPPDLDLPIEERSIGGLGIHLLRQMTDRMAYVREGGWNQLELEKTFGGEEAGS